MQILEWFFKGVHEQEKETSSPFSPPTQREAISDKNSRGKDTITLKHHHWAYQRTKRTEGFKLGTKTLKLFAFICGKCIPKASFYSTLNLSRKRNLNRRRDFVHSVKMKREELSRGVGNTERADSTADRGKKVLPITEASFTTLTERKGQCGTTETMDQTRGDKKKPISRMKELHRWTAATKTDKSGKFNEHKFLRSGTIKAVQDDDQLGSESPKISFTLTWDVENCSTTSSVSSAISIASLSKNGQVQIAHSPIYNMPPEERGHFTCSEGIWITTDSEFVVLEL